MRKYIIGDPDSINGLAQYYVDKGWTKPHLLGYFVREQQFDRGTADKATAEVIEAAKPLLKAKHDQEIATRKAELKATTKRLVSKAVTVLKENDTAVTVPPQQLSAVKALIAELLDCSDLEAFNVELRKKSADLTYDDIAGVACIHRLSVLANGSDNQQMVGTSPFKRIAAASTSIFGREKSLDNRQIRTALTILSIVGFTQQVEGATFKYGGTRRENKAGKWVLKNNMVWQEVFSPPEIPT